MQQNPHPLQSVRILAEKKIGNYTKQLVQIGQSPAKWVWKAKPKPDAMDEFLSR